MSDEKGTTKTAAMWQDKHSRRRGHKLMTRELGDTIPALYANEDVKDYDAVVVPPEPSGLDRDARQPLPRLRAGRG